MNDENEKPMRRENGSEAGEKKAGRALKKEHGGKADFRKTAHSALLGLYPDKNGELHTGEELVMMAVIENAADAKSRNWGKAVDTLLELTDAKATPEKKKKLKAETDALKAKTALLRGGDDGALNKLDEILKELSAAANADGGKETSGGEKTSGGKETAGCKEASGGEEAAGKEAAKEAARDE